MTAPVGRSLLIKRNTLQDGSGTYVTVGGLLDRSFGLGGDPVETTVPDATDPSALPEYTALPGIRKREFQGTFRYDSDQARYDVLEDAESGRTWAYQVVVPKFKTYTGTFMVQANAKGGLEGQMECDATWTPAGAITGVSNL